MRGGLRSSSRTTRPVVKGNCLFVASSFVFRTGGRDGTTFSYGTMLDGALFLNW